MTAPVNSKSRLKRIAAQKEPCATQTWEPDTVDAWHLSGRRRDELPKS